MKALALAALLLASGADAACRQALVLGLDISGSVDAREYRLQLDGLAQALASPAVVAALFALPGAAVDLAVFEWSGPADARLILDWTSLSDPAALAAVTARLRAWRRGNGDASTAVGSAMLRGAALLRRRSSCWRSVLDLSADGFSNTGPRPRDVRSGGGLGEITVNALAIGADAGSGSDRRQAGIAQLSAYFRAEVIFGPGAFVETALGYDDYARAMERKLVRELSVVAIGALGVRDATGALGVRDAIGALGVRVSDTR